MRFRTKTILGIALIELSLFGLLITGTLHTLRQSHESELMRKVLLSEKLLAAACTDAMISNDFATLDNIVKDMLASKQFVYLRFLDDTGFVLAEGGIDEIKHPFSADQRLESVDDGVFDRQAPIDVAGINYGQVQFGVSVKPLIVLLTQSWQRAVSIALINIILVSTFSWLLGSYLVRQLSVLQEASKRFAHGDLNYRIKVKGNDELAETASVFNLMVEKLSETYQQLSAESSEREQTAKKLQRANQNLAYFANIAAHHLQEPARRMISFVQRLASQLANLPLTEDAQISLQFIEQSATRQRALVQDIQRYLVADNPLAQIRYIELETVLQKVMEQYARRINLLQAVIRIEPMPPIILDAPRVYTLCNILVDNALIYRNPNKKLELIISGEYKNGHRYYYFSDNGIGVPEEYRERIFEVFERLEVSPDQTSTGIGLAIVRRIVESCNGSVSLQATDGGGATVILDFPDNVDLNKAIEPRISTNVH